MAFRTHCLECGAIYMLEDKKKHVEFHEKINELIEWAQSISDLIEEQNRRPERHRGKMLGPNPGLMNDLNQWGE